MGGGGKTPFVRYLAQECLKKGYSVQIITRGYRPDDHQIKKCLVDSENLTNVWESLTDETRETAWLLKYHYPRGRWRIQQTPSWDIEPWYTETITLIESGLYNKFYVPSVIIHTDHIPILPPPLGYMRVGCTPWTTPLHPILVPSPYTLLLTDPMGLRTPTGENRWSVHIRSWIGRYQPSQGWVLEPCSPFNMVERNQTWSLITGIAHPEKLLQFLESIPITLEEVFLQRDHAKKPDLSWLQSPYHKITTFKDWARWSTDPLFYKTFISEDLVILEKTFIASESEWLLKRLGMV